MRGSWPTSHFLTQPPAQKPHQLDVYVSFLAGLFNSDLSLWIPSLEQPLTFSLLASSLVALSFAVALFRVFAVFHSAETEFSNPSVRDLLVTIGQCFVEWSRSIIWSARCNVTGKNVQKQNSRLLVGLFWSMCHPLLNTDYTFVFVFPCLFLGFFWDEKVLRLCNALVVTIYRLRDDEVNINRIMKQSLQFV